MVKSVKLGFKPIRAVTITNHEGEGGVLQKE